jgi:integrase
MHNPSMTQAGERGSIFPIQGGKRYRGVVQYRDEFQRLTPKQFSAKTAAKVRKKINDWLKKVELRRPSPKMKVQVCCELYIERCKKKKRAPKTIRSYEYHLRAHVGPSIGHLDLEQLKPGHVEMMMEEIGGLGGAQANARAFLRSAINKIAIKEGVLVTNPAGLADPPEVTRVEREQITPTRFAGIVASEKHPVLRALWLFLAHTGRRPCEVRHLTWEELYEEEDGWWCQVLSSKTPAGKKPFPIASRIMAEIQALPRDHKYVFATSAGTPYNESNLRRAWIETLKDAGLTYTNNYQLRKMFGSVQARKSKDAVTQYLMGHTDIRTTKQFYIGAFPEDLREAVEK